MIDQSAEALLARYEGRRIGAYEILQQIGMGGMGSVYLARRADEAFERWVAVKFLRPGPTGVELTSRFHQERRILARLDHPNVAHLLDGGSTDDGLPYLVMEFVEGKPIDEYCNEHKLNVVDRLVLFRTVCAAVSYSHRNLVVHRDLKPRNILVTSDGTVKLLDFGIAKLLGEETGCVTWTGMHPMTPDYASPEQVLGQAITTASDVYSLGVILYELLTGRSPYGPKRSPLHEVARQICDDIPLRPSDVVPTSGNPDQQAGIVQQEKPERLKKRLSGDVDNIVLTALRKEPHRRYASVDAFSEDLRRHLSGLPVQARKDTLRYRTGKFVIRHPAGVITGAVVLLMMILAVAGTIWQARVARQERARAQEQAQQAGVQRERAEQKSAEADLHRQRAEAAAELAREQLRIVQRQTAEAQAQRREAERQRARAERWANITATTAAILDGLDTSDIGTDLTSKAAAASNILSQQGFDDHPALSNLKALVGRLKDRSARITPTTPAGWQFTSTNPKQFDHGSDQNASSSGSASAYVKSRRAGIEGSATLGQEISADAYRGKRVRVSAALKSRVIEISADLFIYVRDSENVDFASRTLENPLRGTNDWARYSVIIDVPEESDGIVIGVKLNGGGSLWVDDFSIEVVDKSVPVTNNLPRGPLNLAFEGPNERQ